MQKNKNIVKNKKIKMKLYQHIFFDLDDTLWDFKRNAEETLDELFVEFELEKLGENVTLQNLKDKFHEVNTYLWQQFNQNKINKEELRNQRFLMILNQLNVPIPQIPFQELAEAYLNKAPFKPYLLPYTKEILVYLKEKKYTLHIITNGFEHIQHQKINTTKINEFFDLIITSEQANVKKPNKAIFEYATNILNTNPNNCLMIGDNLETDIMGAMQADWDNVWLNTKNIDADILPTYTISNLLALKNIL